MRSYGQIDGVNFRGSDWSLADMAYRYRLWDYDQEKIVFVVCMRELREEIRKFKEGQFSEQEDQSEI